jgi:hypothetical protein
MPDVDPLESVDGRTIYCQKFLTAEATTYELDEVPVAGGPQRPLGISVVDLSFGVVPDGIYFITRPGANGHGEQLRFYGLATRRSRLLQDLSAKGGGLGFSVSPDRKRFLFGTVDGNGRDLMLVENFR